MPLHFDFAPAPLAGLDSQAVQIGLRSVPIHYRRHRFARRYILRIKTDGTAAITIPRGGSRMGAQHFLERNLNWLARQLERSERQKLQPDVWQVNQEIFYRGVRHTIRAALLPGAVQVADQLISVPENKENLRLAIERYFWRLAARELPERTLALAAEHKLKVRRVVVRNQRSRWGSCSARATISLNWRLIQTPSWVVDYLILHELMHLREMNHSPRYWKLVAQVCPNYHLAERWLNQHASLLR